MKLVRNIFSKDRFLESQERMGKSSTLSKMIKVKSEQRFKEGEGSSYAQGIPVRTSKGQALMWRCMEARQAVWSEHRRSRKDPR